MNFNFPFFFFFWDNGICADGNYLLHEGVYVGTHSLKEQEACCACGRSCVDYTDGLCGDEGLQVKLCILSVVCNDFDF